MQKNMRILSLTKTSFNSRSSDLFQDEIMEKIEAIHSRNKQKKNRALQTNKKIINDFLMQKDKYLTRRDNERRQQLENLTSQNIQKSRIQQKKQCQKMKKIMNRVKNLEELKEKERIKTKHQSEEKINHALRKKRENQKKMCETLSHLSKKHPHEHYLTFFSKKDEESKKYSDQVFAQTMGKLKHAEQRKKSLKKSTSQEKDEMRKLKKQNAQFQQNFKEKAYLSNSICKLQKFNERIDILIKEQIEVESKKKQIFEKQLEKVKNRRQYLQENTSKKREEDHQQFIKNYLKCCERKKEKETIFLENLHSHREKIESKVQKNIQKNRQDSRKKADEIYNKTIEQWNCLASSKDRLDKLIQNNMKQNIEISLTHDNNY